MARLIDVEDVHCCSSPLATCLGDVLLFHAIGGQVHAGDSAVELIGSFLQAIVGNSGGVLAPQGLPNTVLFRARSLGRARINVVTGDPFRMAQTTTLEILVES